jgi:hypothetical protein
VRSARHQFFSDTLSKENYESYANMRMKVKLLRALLRPNPPDISMESPGVCDLDPARAGQARAILSGEAKKLMAMNRIWHNPKSTDQLWAVRD